MIDVPFAKVFVVLFLTYKKKMAINKISSSISPSHPQEVLFVMTIREIYEGMLSVERCFHERIQMAMPGNWREALEKHWEIDSRVL